MTDDMSLLVEAFALEASDWVAKVTSDLSRLEHEPGDTAGWRAVATRCRLIANSAAMMELPDIQYLGGQAGEACQGMADHPEWQRSEVVTPLQDGVAVLARLLVGLMSPTFDRAAAVAEGQAAFATWRERTLLPAADPGEPAPAGADEASAPTEGGFMPAWIAADVSFEEPDPIATTPEWPAAEADGDLPTAPAAEAATPPAFPSRLDVGIEALQPTSGTGPLDRLARWRRAFARHGTDKLSLPAEPTVAPPSAPSPILPPFTLPVSPPVEFPVSPMPASPEASVEDLEALFGPAVEDAPPHGDDLTFDHTMQALLIALEQQPELAAGLTLPPLLEDDLVLVDEPEPEPAAEADSAPVSPPVDEVVAVAVAESAPVSPPADEVVAVDEAATVIDPELLEIFNQEVGEHLEALDRYLAILRDQPDDLATLSEARRSLHTLKGAAGMVGLMPVHQLGLVSEEIVEQWLDIRRPASPELHQLARETVAVLRAGSAAAFDPASLAACATLTQRWHAFAATSAPAPTSEDAAAPVPVAWDDQVMGEAGPPDPAAIASWTRAAEAATVAEVAADDGATSAVAEVAADDDVTSAAASVSPVEDEPALADWRDVDADWDVAATDAPIVDAAATGPPDQEPEDEAEPLDMATWAATSGGAFVPTLDSPSEADESHLITVFAAEAGEGLHSVHTLLAQLVEMTADTAAGAVDPERPRTTLLELQRQVHTLKGAAAMVGHQHFTTLAHRMEDVLERLVDQVLPLTPAVVGLLFDTAEVLETMVRLGRDSNPQAARVLATRYTSVLGVADAARPSAAVDVAAAPSLPLPSSAPVIRVDLERMDQIQRFSEELVTQRAAFQERLGTLGGLLRDFERSVERLSRVSRVIEYDYEAWGVAGEQPTIEHDEFDTLEFDRYTEFHRLTGELVEAVADARTVSRDVGLSVTGLNTLVGRQGRILGSLREHLETISLMPLSGLVTLARRVVSQTALHEGKRVAVETTGLDLQVDRTVYETLSTSLGHILRNAVVHGIESAEARQAAGKDEVGRVTVTARQEYYETVVIVRDDGGGIDRQAVQRKAIEQGWLQPGQAMADDELIGLIFRAGLSTAETVDQAAGRGVGLDAVQAAVTSIRGRIVVESPPGGGTIFTIRLPLMKTVANVLIVVCDNRRLAVPMHWLEGTSRVEMATVRQGASGAEAAYGGEWLPLQPLAELLGDAVDLTRRPFWPALVVNAAGRRVLVPVDAMIQQQELAIASLGPSFAWLRAVQGGSVLGNGRVAPVLDMAALLEHGRVTSVTAPRETRPRRVLVVDDSLSVRRVVALALARQGWEALQARHGQEALTILAAEAVDAMVLDVEMPEMDGYALLERLRGHTQYAALPVAMLTSRGADKHRERALALGAQAYLVKPYEEHHLIATVRRLLEGADPALAREGAAPTAAG